MDFKKEELEIINLLNEKEKSSTEISFLIKKNYYVTLKILEKLLNENKIEKINIGKKYVFWKLKNEE